MRDIPPSDLRRMSSRALLALLQFDSWQEAGEARLSEDTLEWIFHIAAEREEKRSDEKSMAFLKEAAKALAWTGC